MDKIKFSIFDIFAYLIPGSIIATAFFIFFCPPSISYLDMVSQLQDITLSSGVILAIMSYVIGFGSDSIASFFYYKTVCRILGSPRFTVETDLNLGEQRALVREFSPANYQFIHNWKVLKTMSHNLSFSFLILLLPIVKGFVQMPIEFRLSHFVIGCIIFSMSIIFIHRAHIFDTWHHQDLASIVKALHLESKALKNAEA